MSNGLNNKTAQGCLGCLGISTLGAIALVCAGGFYTMRNTEAVLEAHKLYDEGRREEAVARYKALYGGASAGGREEMLRRIVAHELARGNSQEARTWVERGFNDGIDAAYDGAAPREWVSALKRDRAHREEQSR